MAPKVSFGEVQMQDVPDAPQPGLDEQFTALGANGNGPAVTMGPITMGAPPAPAQQGPRVTMGDVTVHSVPLRDLVLATAQDKRQAMEIAPSLFDKAGNLDPSKLQCTEDGSWHAPIENQQAWQKASQGLAQKSMEAIKGTSAMTPEQVSARLPGSDGELAKFYMENKSFERWDEMTQAGMNARAHVASAAIKMAQSRGFLPGQKVLPFATPNGGTGEFDLGSGTVYTVDQATGSRQQLPADKSRAVVQQVVQGDPQFFRKLAHVSLPTLQAPQPVTAAQPTGKVAQKQDALRAAMHSGLHEQPVGQVAKNQNDPRATMRSQQSRATPKEQHDHDVMQQMIADSKVRTERHWQIALKKHGGDPTKVTMADLRAIANEEAKAKTK